MRGETGQRLVHGIVDDLVDQVVQAARTGGADVHAWPHADRLKSFQYLEVGRIIVVRRQGIVELRIGQFVVLHGLVGLRMRVDGFAVRACLTGLLPVGH